MNLSVLKDLKYAKKYLQNSIINTHAYPALYIVLSGDVGEFTGYRKQSQKMVRKYGAGEFFCESELLFEIKTKNEFIALTDVIAIVVSSSQALDFIRSEPGMAFELMKEFRGKQTGLKPETETHAPPPPKPHIQKPANEPKTPVTPAPISYAEPVAAPAATPAPAKKAAPAAKQTAAPLFPEGHKKYSLPMNNRNREYLLQKKCECPLCKNEFTMLHVREAKLVHLATDSDMRTRYRDIEPLYYEVITCPACHYSALEDAFCQPDKPGLARVPAEFASLVGPELQFGLELHADSVFAGYYLALLCAPHCFKNYQMAQAKLLYKLCRIYQDAKDTEMELQTAQKALDAYLYVYENMDIPAGQDQQLCILLGELYMKLGNLKNAKECFFKAKLNKQGTPLLQRHAEDRMCDIKEMNAETAK